MKVWTAATSAFLLLISFFLVYVGPTEAFGSELGRATAELRSSDSEWRRERDKYRRQRVSGRLTGEEAAEYASFIASLQRQKLENCEIVRQLGGFKALKANDCEHKDTDRSGTLRHPRLPKPASTDAENIRDLERRLKSLEAELDDELSAARKREDKRAAERVANLPRKAVENGSPSEGASKLSSREENSSTPKWNDPGSEKVDTEDVSTEDNAEEGTPLPTSKNDSSAARTDRRGDPGAEMSRERRKNPSNADNTEGESGNDDDIVLRQIKEAAEKETDPVLREKLWEQYRKMSAARG